ncbi:MAG: GNAT family N-acetyltransferase [Chloroflexi bacterium]|nr:GNAT family N-acetyltransferase [Chloroflexota bacterium]
MGWTITEESFESLTRIWRNPGDLRWEPVFILPGWIEVWWRHFQPDARRYLLSVRSGEDIIGIAPLKLRDGTAFFSGCPDVCDYMDFIVMPGKESEFFTALLGHLAGAGIKELLLEHVRPESSVMLKLMDLARDRGNTVASEVSARSLEITLPPSWDGYLEMLSPKQRHELRRKLRRLREMGRAEYRAVKDPAGIDGLMDTFFQFFSGSRSDKAIFLTEQMKSFFRDMTRAMSRAGLLEVGVLELDSKPTAMVLYFDYKQKIYLYNSCYDIRYDYLSIGILSKFLCIKDSIEKGRQGFDFMKGGEKYKFLLGGQEVPLYSCRIGLVNP